MDRQHSADWPHLPPAPGAGTGAKPPPAVPVPGNRTELAVSRGHVDFTSGRIDAATQLAYLVYGRPPTQEELIGGANAPLIRAAVEQLRGAHDALRNVERLLDIERKSTKKACAEAAYRAAWHAEVSPPASRGTSSIQGSLVAPHAAPQRRR